jgi:hypothetical protein
MKKIIVEKYLKILEYLLVAYIGVILIKVNLIDDGYKKHVILATLFFCFISIRAKKWDLKKFFSLEKFWEATCCYSLVLTFGVVVLYRYSLYTKQEWGASVSTLLEYSLGIVIVQEIIFRIFLWKLGQEIFGEKSVFNVALNTLSFAMMHIVYKGFWDNYLWLLMLFAGLIFSILYYFYPKFYLVLPIHIVLNMVSVHFGIFH